jgi:hypothetical protein
MNSRPRSGLMLLTLLIVLFSTLITARDLQANSSVNVDISIFHDALAPYGNWVNHRTYGQVWYPRNVARDWRPYTDGYWAHTDDYGWLWVSYEPWGWAPFHYGRWAWDNWYGWIWVPGRTWAPAWVFWRSGDGYAAWAPMPPNVMWQPGIGLNISYFNYDRDLSWDSWVAVREYDLPHRHISRRICPPRQNRQIINVTNYTNNVTLINNTIVNQGVPVKQIEEITHKPVVRVVPEVHNKLDIDTVGHHDGQPDIIRLPIAPPTPEEIHHNEELARRLDGKNADGTRTEFPLADLGRSGNQEHKVAGRLLGVPAPVQSPYAKPEQPNPLLKEPAEQTLPLSAIPETPLVGLGLDSDMEHKKPEVGKNQEARAPAQSPDQQSSAIINPIVPILPQADVVPVPELNQQSVATDAIPMPPRQNERKQLEPAKQPDQNPVVNQQIERQQTENLQRQKQIDQLQQELALRQNIQKQQEMEMPHQAEFARQEAARQQEIQNQQQLELQQQQAERANQEAQHMQQQEAARQQEMQNQQQMELQQQQAEHARQKPQQMKVQPGATPQ